MRAIESCQSSELRSEEARARRVDAERYFTVTVQESPVRLREGVRSESVRQAASEAEL